MRAEDSKKHIGNLNEKVTHNVRREDVKY